ncbi:hypothetical protein CMV30_07875 [Nibricoccus aquaticus]|uniref:P pilus assembly protein, chaperone PapD n=1 Tax=Nibricoccus aquaticus TaxID=2576891 RepID=A0A290QHN8_9BACT|nr:hypothetical protein [Nibricoccus aquaticus]ATC63871.1 hypothetical protein CMV30_07875 [Nibricoccus aquaticus]
MKTPRPVLLAALASLTIALAPAQPSPLASSTPPAATIIVSGELTREFQLAPASSAEGQLVLRNTSATPGRARIYQLDYSLDADAHIYTDPGQLPRSNAPWIELGERQPELAPGETRIVPFKVSVPSDPSRSGTYWSMIMVEGLAADPQPENANAVSVRSVIRYGIQIITHVGGSASARPAISHQRIAAANDRHSVCFDLANTGDRWLRPKMELRLFDGSGRSLGVFPAPTTRVYPGASAPQKFDLPALPAGDYLALIVLDTDDELYGAQYRFRLDD